jgi:hypothetical protein
MLIEESVAGKGKVASLVQVLDCFCSDGHLDCAESLTNDLKRTNTTSFVYYVHAIMHLALSSDSLNSLSNGTEDFFEK